MTSGSSIAIRELDVPPAAVMDYLARVEACGFTVLELVPPGLRGTWQLAACAAKPGVNAWWDPGWRAGVCYGVRYPPGSLA